MVILLLVSICFFLPIFSQAAVTSEDCLGCHDTYKGYIHAGVSCTDCHTGIAEVPHAEKLSKPSCRECHVATVKRFNESAHAKKGLACMKCHEVHFLGKGAKQCASCHSSVAHRALPAAGKHLERLQCIACHGRTTKVKGEITLRLKEGSTLRDEGIDTDRNGLIDVVEWESFQYLLNSRYKGRHTIEKRYLSAGDVHDINVKAVLCKDCHETRTRFSKFSLRVRNSFSYEMPLDCRIIVPDIPSPDLYRRTVHGRHGVVCSDCHPAQGSIDATVCGRCHRNISETYDNSVHAKKGAASCTDCHNPHKVKAYRDLAARERIAVCSRCHKDFMEKHGWLPNTTLHFKSLECTSCHSLGSEKSMVFFFARRGGKENLPLAFQDLAAMPGIAGKMTELGETERGVRSAEIAALFGDLRKRLGPSVIVDASLLVTRPYHDYSVKTTREKACHLCHSEQARFYHSMYFALPQRYGRLYVPIHGTLWSSYPLRVAIDVVLIGHEKIQRADVKALFALSSKERSDYVKDLGYKWIDLVGIVLFLIVLLFVLLHLAIKFLVRR